VAGVVWRRGRSARAGLRNLVVWLGVARRGMGGRGAGMAAGGRTEGAEAVFQQVKRLVEGGLGVAAAAGQEPGHEGPAQRVDGGGGGDLGLWVGLVHAEVGGDRGGDHLLGGQQVLQPAGAQGGVGGDDLHVGPLCLGPAALVGDDLRPHRLRRAGSR
jgi:hypothetical protein